MSGTTTSIRRHTPNTACYTNTATTNSIIIIIVVVTRSSSSIVINEQEFKFYDLNSSKVIVTIFTNSEMYTKYKN